MADQIRFKRSSTAASVPTAEQLLPGEPAINTTDGKLFAENTAGLSVFTWSNDAAAAITGGTINGATVGATTAAPGTFTTITGTNDANINSVRVGKGNTSVVHNTVLGLDAGRVLNAFSNGNTLLGYQVGYFLTSGQFNVGIGKDSLGSVTSGSSNMAIGKGAVASNSTGNHNVAIGTDALFNVTGATNIGIGGFAGNNLSAVNDNTCIGHDAGRFHSDGSTALTSAMSSTYIGARTRGLSNSDSNSVVIGANAIGDGANTTVLGTSSTTQTKLHGTSSSVGIISGNRLRIANAKTPASSSDTGTAGDICWDANYLYVCIATNTWRRAAHSAF